MLTIPVSAPIEKQSVTTDSSSSVTPAIEKSDGAGP